MMSPDFGVLVDDSFQKMSSDVIFAATTTPDDRCPHQHPHLPHERNDQAAAGREADCDADHPELISSTPRRIGMISKATFITL